MADYTLVEIRGFEWMPSRIPALDALVHFVPDGPRDAEVDAFLPRAIAADGIRFRAESVSWSRWRVNRSTMRRSVTSSRARGTDTLASQPNRRRECQCIGQDRKPAFCG